MSLLLGCIADDVTGATDLASTLVTEGMTVVQTIGVPHGPVPEADAVVVALKSRTAPVAQAIAESLAALAALRGAGARLILQKVCSTFDSTPAGNIGPVGDALLHALGAAFAPVCPAFPTLGRSVFQGHLFVGAAPLHESGMQDHPLTPMRDANLLRVLGVQSAGTVGLIPYATVAAGADAIAGAAAAVRAAGHRWAIVEAVSDAQLRAIGAVPWPGLIVGGSGIALGLPERFRREGLLPAREAAGALPPAAGHAAVLAGSCSRATLAQLDAVAADGWPVLRLDARATPDAGALAAHALDWARPRLGAQPVAIAASAPPEAVAALQAQLGRDAAGALIEDALARIADGLVAAGVRRLVVAGGETSGAVLLRLGVRRLRIGAAIAPGVPWTFADDASRGGLHLALKSGNFGGTDFFADAFAALEHA